MGPPSYMRSVFNRSVVMLRMSVDKWSFSIVTKSNSKYNQSSVFELSISIAC
jgi:hypothetical protein